MKKLFLASALIVLFSASYPHHAFAQDNMAAFQQESVNQFNAFSQPDANVYTAPPLDYNMTDEEPQPEGPRTVNQYSKKYKKQSPPQNMGGGFLLGSNYDFQFLNTSDINNSTLRFVTPATLTGCAKVIQPETTIEVNPPYLSVKFSSGPHLNIDKNIHYAPFNCNKSRQFAFIDVPLNRAELIDKGIKKIILSGENAQSRSFDINTEDNRFEVISGKKIASFPDETMLVVRD